jgi:radical SAM protein with 4Fe4S-binding SPASM domain
MEPNTSDMDANNSLTHIALDISGSCNLNCRVCSLKRYYGVSGVMSLDTVKKLNSILPQLKGISLQCNCEPLINPNIFNILKHIRSLNSTANILVITNGMLLSEDVAKNLLKSKINRILISVDGATKKTYESIRINAKFETVIKNIKEIVRLRKETDNELQEIGMVAVSTKENLHELLDILKLAKDLGFDSLTLNGLEPYTEEMANNILYGTTINSKYAKIYAQLKATAKEYNIILRLPSLTVVPYSSCELTSCIIDWNGDVHPCSALSYERPFYYLGNKDLHPKLTFGNILSEDLIKIWNSRKFKNFRRDVHLGKFPSYCNNCLLTNKVVCGSTD